MWILLEYDSQILDASIEVARSQNISILPIRQEEQLRNIDHEKIEAVLVGEGWKEATLSWLRDEGVSAPFIYVVPEITVDAYELAKELGCIDVVAYPLPIPYLTEWAKASPAEDTEQPETLQTSKLEKLLEAKRATRKTSTQTTDLIGPGGFLSPSMMRAKIIVSAGIRGAVGKTTTTILTARTLVSSGFSVAVIDLVPRGILLDIFNQQSPVTIDDWVKMPSQMDERMVRQSLTEIRNGGFWLLPSGDKTEDITPADVRKIVQSIAPFFDYILIDTNHAHKVTEVATELATKVMYVMVPDWKAVKRDLEGLNEVVAMKGSTGVVVVVNRIERRKSEHKAALRFYEEADIQCPLIHILEDNVLRREMDMNKPIYGSRWTDASLRDIVQSLGVPPVSEKQPRRWWSR